MRALKLAVTLLGVAVGSAALAQSLKNLPGELEIPAGHGSPGKVAFRHDSHVDSKAADCTSCHPKMFKITVKGQTADGKPITHERMDKGAYCGACHDGQKAFGKKDCSNCHDGTSVPKELAVAKSDDSPGQVTFRHDSHVDSKAADCTSCHLKLFKMTAKSQTADGKQLKHELMEKGAGCGACHDGKKAFGLQDDCTNCHAE